jgi:hypothetical protein
MRAICSRAQAAGPLLGGALFLAGVVQARQIAAGSEHEIAKAARVTGAARVLAGAMLLRWPQLLTTLLGRGRGSGTLPWLARMVAVREIAVGAAAVAAARAGRDPGRWLLVLSLVDGAEALVVLDAIRRDEVPLRQGVAFAAADVGSALTAAALARNTARAPSERGQG